MQLPLQQKSQASEPPGPQPQSGADRRPHIGWRCAPWRRGGLLVEMPGFPLAFPQAAASPPGRDTSPPECPYAHQENVISHSNHSGCQGQVCVLPALLCMYLVWLHPPKQQSIVTHFHPKSLETASDTETYRLADPPPQVHTSCLPFPEAPLGVSPWWRSAGRQCPAPGAAAAQAPDPSPRPGPVSRQDEMGTRHSRAEPSVPNLLMRKLRPREVK